MQQLCIIVQNNAVGIVPFPFLEHYKQDPKCKHYNTNPNNLAEYYYLQLEEDHVGLTLDDVQFALDRLVEFLPDSFKPFVQQAMQMRAVHFCNLFTMRTDLFIEMFNVVFKALNALMIHIGHDRLMTMNCRCVGYLSERLFSVLIWVLKLRGERLMNMPIAVASCTSNPAYRSKTLADTGVECDIDGLKHAIEATNA